MFANTDEVLMALDAGEVETLSPILPTRARHMVGGIVGDAVTGPNDAPQFLDIEMQQIARSGVFLALNHRRGVEMAHAVEFQPTQNATDSGAAQAQLERDAIAGPAWILIN